MSEAKKIEKEIKSIIEICVRFIHEEKFDELTKYYTEEAILIVKPDLVARGRAQIKSAFIKIAAYFDNSIKPIEGKIVVCDR
ncbi:MAG: hypothetical protein ACTIOK_06350 [Enterococcus malodoratus]|uniref:hypothetical protein n=1 Tax=Enterococcus malodoratus TaxID=71451 RepID=UPI0020731E70|nr:hypothetical protein [Enterococcus malodoratus]